MAARPTNRQATAAALVATFLLQPALGATVYAIADQELLRFDSSNPNGATSLGVVQGLAPGDGVLSGLDFNPVDGRLYGATTSHVYTIDTSTARATVVGMLPSRFYGDIDFHPRTGELRLLSEFVNLLCSVDGELSCNEQPHPGSAGSSLVPSVIGYASGTSGTSPPQLYGIGDIGHLLLDLDPDTAAYAETIAAVLIPSSRVTSLDIVWDGQKDVGYLSLYQPNETVSMFYQIDLTSGVPVYPGGDYAWAELFIGDGSRYVAGMAVQPVPAPPALWLLLTALLSAPTLAWKRHLMINGR